MIWIYNILVFNSPISWVLQSWYSRKLNIHIPKLARCYVDQINSPIWGILNFWEYHCAFCYRQIWSCLDNVQMNYQYIHQYYNITQEYQYSPNHKWNIPQIGEVQGEVQEINSPIWGILMLFFWNMINIYIYIVVLSISCKSISQRMHIIYNS